MSSYEKPSYSALLAEQKAVQAGKFQGRQLKDYNELIFPGETWKRPVPSAVADFMRPLSSNGIASLQNILLGMSERTCRPANWVDMGGGRALPMRLIGSEMHHEEVMMTNVDLFDYRLDGLTKDERAYLETNFLGITHESATPKFIASDVETVVLPESADLITSVETIQYLNNPLASIQNWYNQLSDDGTLIISSKHNIAEWIRYKKDFDGYTRENTPTKHLFKALGDAGVSFAITYETDWENGSRLRFDANRFRTLAIRKQPGTQTNLYSSVVDVWENPYSYKAVYYDQPPADEGRALLHGVLAAELSV